MTTIDDGQSLRRGERLSALLAAADPPPRSLAYPADRIARAQRRAALLRRVRIAAAAALFLAAVGVPPVRAWIAQSVRAVWTRVAGGPPAAPEPAPPAPAPTALGSVTFAPPAGRFTLRIAEHQAAGTLTVELTADSTAEASITGGGDAADLLVLPDGLRIANHPASTAAYVVRLPARLGQIDVQIGRDALRSLRPDGATRRWVLDLRASESPNRRR